MKQLFTIKNISENIGLISITILIGTMVRLYVFYLRFNLNILPLIDLSEIPKYSVDILVMGFLLILGLGTNILMYFRYRTKKEMTAEEERLKNLYSPKENRIIHSLIMMTCLVILVFFHITFKNGVYFIIPIMMGYSIYMLVQTIILKEDPTLNEKYGVFFTPLIFSSIICFYLSIACLDGVMVNKNKYVVFKYEEIIIKSNQNYYCIGSTNNYYFMYNEKNMITSIYEKDKISFFNSFKLKSYK